MRLLTHMVLPALRAIGAAICMLIFLAAFLFLGHAMGFH